MPKKLSKEDIEYREGVAMFNAWTKQNKKLEKQGLVGVDFYIKKVEQLEAKVKILEAKALSVSISSVPKVKFVTVL